MQATAIPVRGNVATDAWLPQAEGNREQVTLARDRLQVFRAAQDEQATRVWRRRHAEDYLRHCELRRAEANNRLAEAWQRRNTAEDSVMQAEWGVAETLAVERGFAATTRPRRKRRRTAEAVAAEPAQAEAVAAEAAVAE